MLINQQINFLVNADNAWLKYCSLHTQYVMLCFVPEVIISDAFSHTVFVIKPPMHKSSATVSTCMHSRFVLKNNCIVRHWEFTQYKGILDKKCSVLHIPDLHVRSTSGCFYKAVLYF